MNYDKITPEPMLKKVSSWVCRREILDHSLPQPLAQAHLQKYIQQTTCQLKLNITLLP